MTYSNDLKERVLDFVKSGGGKAAASRLFSISRVVIYKWLSEGEVPRPKTKQTRRGRIDRATLMRHIQDQPDVYQRELARTLGVSQPAISKMLRTLGLVKKTAPVRRAR